MGFSDYSSITSISKDVAQFSNNINAILIILEWHLYCRYCSFNRDTFRFIKKDYSLF